MAFGTSQIKNPTPTGVNVNVGIVSGVAGVVIAWLQTATFIPDNVSEIISGILGLIIGISQVLRPMFGIKVSGDVPAEKVTAIDTEPK